MTYQLAATATATFILSLMVNCLVGCGLAAGDLISPQMDTDADGLSDARELALGTDPDNPDSDSDGAFDGIETAGGTSPLAVDSDRDGLADGIDPEPDQSPNGATPVSTGNDIEPNDSFGNAVTLSNTGSGARTFEGRVDLQGDVDMFDLGPLTAGDRLAFHLRATAISGSLLAGIFDSDESLLTATQEVQTGQLDMTGLIDEIVRHHSDHYYFGVTHKDGEPAFGSYRFDVTIEREMERPTPVPQIIFLDFDGGTLSTPLLGVSLVSAFDANLISPLYDDRTEEIKEVIIERFRANFSGFNIETITSDEVAGPLGETFTTLLFGSFHESVLGVSIALDRYNMNQCDDGIIFAEAFKPNVFGFPPPADALGVAIANVAAHEAGHLLGLYHVTDPTALMDERSPAIHLLTDQRFKTAPLSESAFPFGHQNARLLLAETVGETP